MKAVHALEVVQVDIDLLRPDPANPRRISEVQIEALTRSIREYGFVQPVLARRKDGTVIAGHQRLTAAKAGLEDRPDRMARPFDRRRPLLNLSLNKVSGEWDEELLARLIADLTPVTDLDLSLSGFTEEELVQLLKSLDVREKKDRVKDFDLDAAMEAARAAQRPTWRAVDVGRPPPARG